MAHVPATVRRKQIIEAAATVIASEGVAGASTRAIAREAGVPLATLHYVFATKDEVLAGVLDLLIERAKQALDESLEEADLGLPDVQAGLADVLRRLVQTYWSKTQRDLGTQRVQYELILHGLRTPQADELGRALYGYYLDATESLIREAYARTGETIEVSPRDLAHLIVCGIDGILLHNLVHTDDGQSHRSLDDLVGAALALTVRTCDESRADPAAERMRGEG